MTKISNNYKTSKRIKCIEKAKYFRKISRELLARCKAVIDSLRKSPLSSQTERAEIPA
ncbi:hypothetical protein [uncultured Clostridium sp.]|uniref:hypothetical protein n=1 Tax=uncultured Clostridium sp. TaxID=59620 RepID=UPI0025E8DD69|nr:hypothetical protein [uncultured Clostridium sp.]